MDCTDVFNELPEKCMSELPKEMLGFICELIKEKRPKKILEIGVSAGGTTCIIMNCLQKLNLDSEMYSVDLAETYHFDTSKRCGFQIHDASPFLSNINQHHLLLGKTIAERIEDITKDGKIDFVILDTVHYLPGELLDFIACFPYLADDAIVILDDLIFCHTGENTSAVATRVLFDSVVGNKYIPDNAEGWPKMGAFQIGTDTKKYIDNLFCALAHPWGYDMESSQVMAYREIIKEKYTDFQLKMFDDSLALNKQTIDNKENIRGSIKRIIDTFNDVNEVYIYGAGQRGIALCKFLEHQGKNIKGFIVSNGRSEKQCSSMKYDIQYIDDIDWKSNTKVLVAVADDLDIINNLEQKCVDYYNTPNYIYPFIKEY